MNKFVSKLWHKFWRSYHHARSYALYERYTASSTNLNVLYSMHRFHFHADAIAKHEGGK